MTYAAHCRAILVLGLPLIGGHLAQVAIGMVDTLMLGWYSVEALAAGVLGSSFFFLFFLAGSGFAWALMPMVAEVEQDASGIVQTRRVTRMSLWLSVLYGALCFPLFWWSGAILVAAGQEPEIAALAQGYLRIVAFGMIPALVVMALKSYLAALESTQVVLWVTVAAAAVNAGVNYLLIFGTYGFPELGVRGAAIASVAVQIVSLAGLCLYAVRVYPEHDLFARFWRPDWAAFARVFRLGWPIGLTTLTEVVLFSGSALMMGWLGKVPLAAHGIVIQIASATFVLHLGLSNTATIRAGKAYGRRDFAHLRRGGYAAIGVSVAFAAVAVVFYLTMPTLLVGAFVGPNEPERAAIISAGAGLMVYAALFQLVDGAQVMALGLLRGLQETRWPMIAAAVSYWLIGLPACYVLGFVLGWGGPGVWLGLGVGLLAASALLMYRFWGQTLPRAEA